MRSNAGVFPFVYRSSGPSRFGLACAIGTSVIVLGVVALMLPSRGETYVVLLAFAAAATVVALRGFVRALEMPDELRVGDQGIFLESAWAEGFFGWDDVLEVRFGRKTVTFTVRAREQRGPVAIVRERRAVVYDTAGDPEHFKLKPYLAARMPAERMVGNDVRAPRAAATAARVA